MNDISNVPSHVSTAYSGGSPDVSATRPSHAQNSLDVAVLGGGLAGLAAAVELAERGLSVAVFEANDYLGGRLGSWVETLNDGSRVTMERGFHAFFRNYLNLRELLERVDPGLSVLSPVPDYPVADRTGATLSFEGLPKTVPLNLLAVILRSRALPLRDALKVPPSHSRAMVDFSMSDTYRDWDGLSAADFISALRISGVPSRLLFDVFAHSFFNDIEVMSAAEMLQQFHFYFLANSRGLVFDVCNQPFSTGIIEKLADYLRARGVKLHCGTAVQAVEVPSVVSKPGCGGPGFRLKLGNGGEVHAQQMVCAMHVEGTKALFQASPSLGSAATRRGIEALEVAQPFVVQRLWFKGDVYPERPVFLGTTGFDLLDNISLMHRIESESRVWAEVRGGSVIELHAYAVARERVGDEKRLGALLRAELARVYPETAGLELIDSRLITRTDCPAFKQHAWVKRPAVDGSLVEGSGEVMSGLAFAGDYVRLEAPSALMERAVMSGKLAAGVLLEARGIAVKPLRTLPAEGWLRRGRRALGLV